MTSKKVLVDLFYDVVSPYSYLGFENLLRCTKKWTSMDLKLRPMFIGGVVNATGTQVPGVVPAKAKYMLKDLKRKSEFFNIPYNEPKDVPGVIFTNSSLKAQRLLCMVEKEQPEILENLSREFYHRVWVRDQNINKESSILQACMDVGIEQDKATAWIKRLDDPETKEALKKATEEAISFDAYGAPTYVAHLDSETLTLFGCDQIYLLAKYLNEKWDFSNF